MLLYIRDVVCVILRIQMILEPNSTHCNLRGAFDPCGTCKCASDFYGDKCECIADNRIRDQDTALTACTQSDSAIPCSGKGECRCGYCECSAVGPNITDKYYGQYCDCDDFSCPMHDDKLCGGHGTCSCGKCYCVNGYTGDACDTMSSEIVENKNSWCIQASSCEECFKMGSSCGWYKHMDLPSGVGSRCNVYDIHLSYGISSDDILTSETTPNTTAILEYQSYLCSNRGSTNVCGDCVCNEGYFGKKCECELPGGATVEEVLSQCISPKSTSLVSCSGRGECICGYCDCYARRAYSNHRYSGKYCQCDDYSCSYYNNMLCGGHGWCHCGKCQCEHGFTGEACECPTAFDTCLSSNGQLCNGQGECVCGRCICGGMYRGPTCEQCPTCPGLCQTYKICALCKLGSGAYTQEECSDKCPTRNVHMVHALNYGDEKLCSFTDWTDGGRFEFTYSYDNYNQVVIKVLPKKEAA